MAHSIQSVGARAVIINDFDLLVLVRMMLEEVSVGHGLYESLAALVPAWERCLESSGPGTVDLKLEELRDKPSAKSELRMLFSKVRLSLLSWGEEISEAVLNSRYRIRGAKFSNYKTDRLRSALGKIETLLEGMDAR